MFSSIIVDDHCSFKTSQMFMFQNFIKASCLKENRTESETQFAFISNIFLFIQFFFIQYHFINTIFMLIYTDALRFFKVISSFQFRIVILLECLSIIDSKAFSDGHLGYFILLGEGVLWRGMDQIFHYWIMSQVGIFSLCLSLTLWKCFSELNY